MKYSDKELITIENKLVAIFDDLFYKTFITEKYYSPLKMHRLLTKHGMIKFYYHKIAELSIKDAMGYIGKERFPLFASEETEEEIINYLIPYILFFMEDNYMHISNISSNLGITIEEAYLTSGKQRMGVFVRDSVNTLYNETTVQTSKAAGILYFEFVAVIDERTSDICRSLNGMIFSINQLSYYAPPLHPHCRSRVRPMKSKFNMKRLFKGNIDQTDSRRISWYKSKVSFILQNLNVDKMIVSYL